MANILNPTIFAGGVDVEVIYTNPNPNPWANGQNVSVDFSDVDFAHDLIWFEATIQSNDTSKKQYLCLNGKTSGTICGNLVVSGGGWHARSFSFSSTGFSISAYANWGGPNISKVWRIKDVL